MKTMSLEELIQKLPWLSALLVQYGDWSILDYAKQFYRIAENEDSVALQRKSEFLDILSSYSLANFWSNITSIVIDSLSQNFGVSTAEHHGPHGHPFFWQSTLLRAIAFPQNTPITFATSNISLGNTSYPRGLLLRPMKDCFEKALLLPFFPASMRKSPVFGMHPYTRKDIENSFLSRVEHFASKGLIHGAEKRLLKELASNILMHEDILQCRSYSHQITRVNYELWKNCTSQSLPTPTLSISLDAEEIVAELILHHLQTNGLYARMLTDDWIISLIETTFDGVDRCFNTALKSGTFLFWHLDENHRRIAMWKRGNALVSDECGYSLRLERSTLEEALSAGRLIPSGLLLYTMFSCYYWVTCFGGFSQWTYLPIIQSKFLEIAHQCDIPVICTKPDIFCEDIVPLQCEGRIATFLDLYLGNTSSIDIETFEKSTLRDCITAMIPEISRCVK